MFIKRKRKRIILKLFLLLILAVGIDFYLSNFTVGVTNVTINKSDIPKDFNDFKIVQISDLHDKDFGNNNEQLVQKIKQQKPDIIVMTGDMLDGSHKDTVFRDLCKQLTEIADTYYISGNHELGSSRYRNTLAALSQETGVKYLKNQKVKIKRGNSYINLYGYELSMRYYSQYQNLTVEDLNQQLSKTKENEFNILLAHTPIYFNSYSNWGADLTLCGHMHGGMVRIPFKGGLLSPHGGFFPKYDAGLFSDNKNYMYVNKGLSGGSVGVRVYNQPEITSITLKIGSDR